MTKSRYFLKELYQYLKQSSKSFSVCDNIDVLRKFICKAAVPAGVYLVQKFVKPLKVSTDNHIPSMRKKKNTL